MLIGQRLMLMVNLSMKKTFDQDIDEAEESGRFEIIQDLLEESL
jgi:hypothetical protein